MKTTRLSQRYRDHLFALRSLAYALDDNAECDALLGAIDALAFDMANKRPLTEDVELDKERDAAGITSVLDDTAGPENSDRDARHSAAE